MFTIVARRLASVLSEFRRVLGVGKLVTNQLVTFIALGNRLTIRAKNEETVVSYETNCVGQDSQFTVRLSDLKFAGQTSGTVKLEAADGKVTALSRETSRTTTRSFDLYSAPDYPNGNLVLYSNRTELATAILNAAKLTDSESKRYAIGCIRLRSSDGQVAGTDGRQALVHGGFSFPAGEILVPASAIASHSALKEAIAISVGLRGEWFALRFGTVSARWSLDIKNQATGRFPDVDLCMPRLRDSKSRLILCESDAQFLIELLKRLSPDRSQQGPITLDLGDAPIIRMRLRASEYSRLFPQQSRVHRRQIAGTEEQRYCLCEICLDASTCSGEKLCCAVDHLHLQRLLELGFRQIDFQSDHAPFYCIDQDRAYACAVSSPGFVINPEIVDLHLTKSSDVRVA